MLNISKKAVSVLLVVILLTATFVSAPVTTQAASYPTTHPNTYKNTGNGAVDITEVAKTQVGYKENSAGTKYGYWYNPAFVNQPWCAMFVSWCADQAGISQEVIKSFASCSVGVNWFKSQGIWHDSAYYGGNYVPKKGDIIFYRNNGSSNLSDHVGIVLGVNGSYIHCIEGNATNSACCEFTSNSARTLNNKFVIGYASPNYSGSGIDTTVDEPTEYENWQVTTADTLSLRESYTTSSTRLTTIPMGKILKVKEFKTAGTYLWGYTTYNSKKGWCALDYCEYINGNIDGVYYQLPPKFSASTASVYVQQKQKLTSENTLTVTYKSSDNTIAKVSKNGNVTGIAKGTAIITCTTPTGKDTCTVTVKNPTLKKNTLTTNIDETCTIQLTGAYETVTYESNDTSIATVDAKGVVTGVSAGTTKVVVTTASGVQLKCTIKVNKESDTYQRFKVAKNKVYLKDGYQGKNVVQIPKDTVVKVTEVKYSDTYTWGKTTYNDKSGWVVLNNFTYIDGNFGGVVYKALPYLTETKKTVYVGDTYTISPKSCEGTVSYKSQKTAVASVSKKGVVTALKAGTANIIVTNGTTELQCKIIVKNPTLNKTELSIVKDGKATLTVKGGSGDITYKSSDKTIATVSKKGVITAKAYGTATITVNRNGVAMECVVKVSDPQLSETTITLKEGNCKRLTVSQSYSSEIKWKSSDKTIVRVSKKGNIRGLAKGKTTVTALVEGVTLTCTVKVK